MKSRDVLTATAATAALAIPNTANASEQPVMDPAVFEACAADILDTTGLKPIIHTEATASHAGKNPHVAKGWLAVRQFASLNSFVEGQGIVNCDGKATVAMDLELKAGSFTRPVPKFRLKRILSNAQNAVISPAHLSGTFSMAKACEVAEIEGKKQVDVRANESITYKAPGYPAVASHKSSFLARLACERGVPDVLPVTLAPVPQPSAY